MSDESRKLGEEPRYTMAEAARIVEINVSTFRAWFKGTGSFRPVIALDDRSGEYVSFYNLIEARFLAKYRESGVAMKRIREAILWVQENADASRPLLERGFFESDGLHLFYRWQSEHAGRKLVNASRSGQLAWPEVVEDHFKDIDFDEYGPIRIYLFGRHRPITASPLIQFGSPTLEPCGVRTEVIYGRFQAGESIDELAEDFGCQADDVQEAIRWEARLAPQAA